VRLQPDAAQIICFAAPPIHDVRIPSAAVAHRGWKQEDYMRSDDWTTIVSTLWRECPASLYMCAATPYTPTEDEGPKAMTATLRRPARQMLQGRGAYFFPPEKW